MQSLNLTPPLTAGESTVVKRALVIGGGIAGIQSALDIAEAGYEVDIVEKSPTIGGRMAQLDKTFPTLDCAACILTPKMVEASQSEKVPLFTYSEVEAVSGFVGNFTVKITQKSTHVKAGPLQRMRRLHPKMPVPKIQRTSLTWDFTTAVPFISRLRRQFRMCRLSTAKPASISKPVNAACARRTAPPDAIDFEQQDEIIEREYGAIVVATGYKPISLEKFDEFAYSQSPDVVSSLEFERMMNAAGPTKAICFVPPTTSSRIPLCSFNASVPVIPPAAAKPTAPKSAACIRQSTPCWYAKNIRTRKFTCSISTCALPARISMNSTAVRSNSTAWIT